MRTARLVPAVTFAVAAGLSALPVSAHDLWIDPERMTAPAGSELSVSLRVGDAFTGEPVARNPRWIDRFVAVGPQGEQPLGGSPGAIPAASLQPEQPGTYWLLYRSRPSSVTLDAARFEAYLAEEGLDHVLAARRERGEQTEPARERFSRCAKALLRVGPEALASEAVSRSTGLVLDLVPLLDPAAPGAAVELPLRLDYEGSPLAGTLVEAHGPGGLRLSARTDSAGRASFPLAVPGNWLITAVHMVPAPADSGADWESIWASLRFERPAS